jgi:hypothetical protein
MLPSFTGIPRDVHTEQEMGTALAAQGVIEAGFWDWLTGGDSSQGQRCNLDHTETKCILFTMWCKNVFVCDYNPGSFTTITKDSGWYICGACGNPFDW